MRIKLDVMEKERKTLRRDYISLGLFVCIILLTAFHLYYVLVHENTKLSAAEDALKQVSQKLRGDDAYQAQIANLNLQKTALEGKVNFINSVIAAERFSWFNLFHTLETVTPSRAWIKDLSFKEGEYKITGEAASLYEVTDMLKGMQKLNCFSAVNINKTEVKEIDENLKVTEFVMSFRL